MSETITADTDIDALAARIGGGGDPGGLRKSRSRREPHLQKYARLLAQNSEIELTLNANLAAADMEVGNQIYIPAREFGQPVTDIPRRPYDLLMQEMLTTHEVGHILYSDWTSFKKWMDEVETVVQQHVAKNDNVSTDDWEHIFKELWNAAEDGVIENELGKRFIVENEFTIMNANLAEEGSVAQVMESPTDDGVVEVSVYGMRQAFIQALLDAGVYDSGRTDQLVDPDDDEFTFYAEDDRETFIDNLDDIQGVIDTMMALPRGSERNKAYFEWFRDVAYPIIKDATLSNTRNAAEDEDASPEYGRSDDAHEGIGDADEDLQHVAEARPAGAEEGDEDGGGDDDIEEVAGQVEEDASRELREEGRAVIGDDTMDEIEEFVDIMQEGAPATLDRIVLPDDGTPRPDIKRQARVLGRKLHPILKDKFRETYYDKYKLNKTFGEVDNRSMMDAERGSLRTFKRKKQGEKKNYSCVILDDRSGSMSNDIDDLEISTGAFIYLLEWLGIDTMCLEFCHSQLRLAKAFGQPIDEAAGTLFSGDVGGGTPLSDGLYFARKRVEAGAGDHPFIIVITDGRAGNLEQYREQLEKTPCEVIGVYIDSARRAGSVDPSQMREMQMFHRFVVVTADDNLAISLQRLAGEIIL